MEPDQARALRSLPNVNDCISQATQCAPLAHIPLPRLKHCIRLYIDIKRQAILRGIQGELFLPVDGGLPAELIQFIRQYHEPRFRRVINATGVVVHTNLGRSLLPNAAAQALTMAALYASNLEYNLAAGARGSRYQHVDELLCELTGAEAALVVNNNAAAVLLALNTLANGKEVIVSRGQLVEIGGSFRIPDIMARSGARLVEVGTTNRTHSTDYLSAFSDQTGLLLKVHCSNYRIIGFTSEVDNVELVRIGTQHGIPVMEDLGSGSLIDFSRFGLSREPTVQEVVASGVDVVTFSGDKLLGGPQAGIIVGKRCHIEPIKNNPLNRALRIDKFTLAGLESVLRLYLDEAHAIKEIPTLARIAATEESIRQRGLLLLARLNQISDVNCTFRLVQTFSQVGGGAMPEENLPSWAVAVKPHQLKPGKLELRLRQVANPVIGRIEEDCLLLDLRTIADEEFDLLAESLVNALNQPGGLEKNQNP